MQLHQISSIHMIAAVLLILLVDGDSAVEEPQEAGLDGQAQWQCDRREAGLCPPGEPTLAFITPVEVGHVEELDIDPQRTLFRKTLSLKPALFEIENFLTSEECDHLRELAIKTGLKPSVTFNNGATLNQPVQVMDMNGNRQLDISEMRLTLENSYDIYLGDEDVLKMYDTLSLDKNNDGLLTPSELSQVRPGAMQQWLREYVEQYPSTQSRVSSQVWLYADRVQDQVVRRLQDRVQRLTQLPAAIIEKSDVQVVRYGVGGHYHAHHDSADLDEDKPCCNPSIKTACRICRYMTILFYLNDVGGGGSTAFPVADNATMDINKLRYEHLINLREHCEDARLAVSPARGKAVMWYNHRLDPTTGWMGPLDGFSWHGGCPVTSGEKWIANFWIKTTDDKEADIKRMQL